ncbi:MAG: ABC transporter ATP-binding protein [Alistipes sp.]|nr:ABC transporter ATP-binding protein [Candidatus Alistipes equi]
MIRIENLGLSYGTRTVLKEASAQYAKGEISALIARNGAGKSTLLHAICKEKEINAGHIYLDGNDVAKTPANKMSKLLSIVSTLRTKAANLTVKQAVLLGRSPYTNWLGQHSVYDIEVVENALSMVNMTSYGNRDINSLSDGEFSRAMIARAIAQDTGTIILDEPCAFLDIPSRYEICRLLRELAIKKMKCIIYSTHDIDCAIDAVDTISVIDNCQLKKYDAKKDGRQIIKETFGI